MDRCVVCGISVGNVLVLATDGKAVASTMGAGERCWVFGVSYQIYIWYGASKFYSPFTFAIGNKHTTDASCFACSIVDNFSIV